MNRADGMTASGALATERRVINPDELPGQAAALLGQGFRIALVAGHEDIEDGAGFGPYTCSPRRCSREHDPTAGSSCTCRSTAGSPGYRR